MPLIFDKDHNVCKMSIDIKDEFIFPCIGYEVFIKKHLESGTKIPNRVLKKYFSFFQDDLDREKFIGNVVSKVMERFNGTKYDFSGTIHRELKANFYEVTKKGKRKGKPLGATHEDIEYSFSLMLKQVLYVVVERMTRRIEKPSVHDIIKLAYDNMCDYMNEYFNEQDKKQYEKYEYKFGAISSYISLLLGFDPLHTNNPTNHELYQYSRNARKRAEKKKL